MSETVILVGVVALLAKELVALARRLLNGKQYQTEQDDHALEVAGAAVVARDVVEIKKSLEGTRKDIHDLRDAITPLASTLGVHEWRLRALEKREEVP